jgi:hypothetical protein
MQEVSRMATEIQTGMDRAEMKRLLLKSKQEPVNCAIGIGNDKSVALLMLSHSRSSKSLQGDLQKDFPTAFNTRFGTAVVDTDDDPTLVKFMINKAVGSMARRLVKTLKGTGFRKVQLLLEDGSPVETATEEEGAEQPGIGADSATGAPSPQAAPMPDAAALAAALTELVRRFAEVTDPARKEALAKQAREANVNIKLGNLIYAAAGIEQLRRELQAAGAGSGSEQPSQSAPPPPPPPPSVEAKPDLAALTQALGALIPRIAEVADPARKEALAKLAREANVNIKTGNLTYAAAGIEQLRSALDAAAAEAAQRKVDADAARLAWEALFREVEPRYLKVVSTPSPEVDRLRTIMTFATDKAETGDYAKATAALQRLEPLLQTAPTSPDIGISESGVTAFLAAWAKAKTQLRAGIDAARGQLARLAEALLAANEPNFIWVAEHGLSDLFGSLLEGAGKIERATSKLPVKTRALARPVIEDLRKRLDDPRIAACDANQYGVPVTVRATIGHSLDELEQVLAMAESN